MVRAPIRDLPALIVKLKPQPLTETHWKHAIKTGIAGALAIFLAERLHLPQGYWAAISAVIVMQSEFQATLRAGFTRLAGTAIGALVALPFAETIHSNIVGFGVAVVLTVLICSVLKLEESQRLGAATVALIMLTGPPGAPLLSAIYRFLEVSLGIIVSLLVTRILWPSRSRL